MASLRVAAVGVDGAVGVADVEGLADVDLRFAVEIEGGDGVAARQGVLALRFQAAVVDAVRQAQVLHGGVVGVGPGLAPEQERFSLAFHMRSFLAAKPVGGDGAVGEQHMGVPVAGIAAVLDRRPVDGHVGDHAARREVRA